MLNGVRGANQRFCNKVGKPVKFDQFALITAGFTYSVFWGGDGNGHRKSLKLTRYNFSQY